MKIVSSLFIALLFFNLQCNTTKPTDVNTEPRTVKEQVRQGAMLVDVRTPEEFAEGSIDGAVNIPLDQVQSRVDEFRGKPSVVRSEEHTSELQSRENLVCRLLLEKKKTENY